MESRRAFIKKAGLLAGSIGLMNSLPDSIQAALKIDPKTGSTYLEAEHIVMVMQENRSFDHSFGALRGVRGFNDPRAVKLADGRPVWLQSNLNGDTYVPFRLDIKNSNAAWTRDLPHSWENQIGAWNKGQFNGWLEWKHSGNKKYRDIPLTLGYYTRQDIPFYYAFADAFTICDQHFCSSITGTTTNRHHFWTGTCVPEKGAKPLVRNSDVYFRKMAKWTTFPERLEQSGISWKIYQNEVSIQNGLSGEAESFLGNFTDNNLEWFEQYNIRYNKSHMSFYAKRIDELPKEISNIQAQLKNKHDQKLVKKLEQKKQQLESFKKEFDQYNPQQYVKLSDFSKSLHERAFQSNENDPNFHQIEEVEFRGTKITVPKGDVLYQFRKDVDEGTLPTVSWLVAPQNFSDHPSAPMYGAWYISEILNILTKNREVWKKTIFILNYDENDGYFDHVPPFTAPKPGDLSTGMVTPDLDCSAEYVTKEQELNFGIEPQYATEGPVGLGYRVPLIIASPWSRGGWVNSEVFDITSTIQFLEHFLNKKYGKNIIESNISSWRRAITGDLTSVFRPFSKGNDTFPEFIERNEQIAKINNALEKPYPNNYKKLSKEEIRGIRSGRTKGILPDQEKGGKLSNALCYDLHVNELINDKQLTLKFESSLDFFREKSLAGVFNVYAYGFKQSKANWSFACSAGNHLTHDWSLLDFNDELYHLAVHGPNGFYRKLQGDLHNHTPEISLKYDQRGERLIFNIENKSNKPLELSIYNGYQKKFAKQAINACKQKELKISVKDQHCWYDFEFSIVGTAFKRQYAGRLENGKDSITDPLMGG